MLDMLQSLELTKGGFLVKIHGKCSYFGSFQGKFGIHESIPMDSNLESTNPGLKDSNLANPMTSLVGRALCTKNQSHEYYLDCVKSISEP